MTKAMRDPLYLETIARLRAARRQAGVSQVELARRLGVRQSVVSKVETGERRLDVVEFIRWCREMGVSAATVLPQSLEEGLLGQATHER